MTINFSSYLKKITLPSPTSHKGQNGRLLVIGGSRLFHASIFWSADVASRIVDIVHFTSPDNENNELVRYQLKQGFWNGIVVDWVDVESYIKEDDCILIGPGMERGRKTKEVVNSLLEKYPEKKWVIDGGALQEVDVKLLNKNCIVTPHSRELSILKEKTNSDNYQQLLNQGVIILAKGQIDRILYYNEDILVDGGNAGMTKGGTGDVLAGLMAALYCQHDATTAAVTGSYITKKAGDSLFEKVGPYFNAGDLVREAPMILWKELGRREKN